MCDEKKNLVKEGFSQNKILFSFQQGQTANSQTATIDFPTFPALGRQIPNLLLASGFIENQTDSDSSLSPHLVSFVMCLFCYFCFYFAGSWIVGLVIGRTESRSTHIAIDFSR